MKKPFLPTVAALALMQASSLCALGQTTADIATLKQRLLQYRTKVLSTGEWSPKNIRSQLDTFYSSQAGGSWSDIDYDDESTGGERRWQPWEHLWRLEVMAAAYRDPANATYYNSSAMRTKILAGIDFWITSNPQALNAWWQNTVGTNQSWKTIAILMESELTTAQKNFILASLYVGIQGPDTNGAYRYFANNTVMTGMNYLWVADIHLHAALLKNSTTEIGIATANIKSVTAFTTAEGVNVDGSFHQHGVQIMNGLYGFNFLCDSARNAYVFRGLASFQFNATQLGVIRDLALNGTRWMTRRGTIDPLVVGRLIARKGFPDVRPDYTQAMEDLRLTDTANAASYQALKDHLAGTNDGVINGNRHFWRGDYTVHRRTPYSFHIRTSSVRTDIIETGNDENLKNLHEAQGMTMLLMTGDEYQNLFPCMAFDQLPGTTAPVRTTGLKTANWSVRGTRDFVGGVSNGTYGVAAKDLNWDGTTGKKSWFMFDDDIVCLGAGFTYSGTAAVRTTLNQCIKKGDVYVEYGSGTGTIAPVTTSTASILSSPKWVHHDNVGYVLKSAGNYELKNQTAVTGDWYSINTGSHLPGTTETKARFTLMHSHGTNPSGASYAYILLPEKDRTFVQSYAAAPQSTIIVNSATQQAVRNSVKKSRGSCSGAQAPSH